VLSGAAGGEAAVIVHLQAHLLTESGALNLHEQTVLRATCMTRQICIKMAGTDRDRAIGALGYIAAAA